MYFTDSTLSSIAPSNFPQSLTVVALSPTSLNVSWQPVPAIDRNGIITQYTVDFDPVQTFGGQLMNASMVVDASESYVILEGLQEYVEYNVTVRASTVAGDGEYSPTVQQRTLEDGENTLFMLHMPRLAPLLCVDRQLSYSFSSTQFLLLLRTM